MYWFRNLSQKAKRIEIHFWKQIKLLEVYINDSFYKRAYQWLKPKLQGESSILINRTDKCQIIEKQWRVTTDIDVAKILHKQNRYVVLKKELFTILAGSHSAMVH